VTFPLGRWRVHRAGYGAMQLAGDGVFGPPRDPVLVGLAVRLDHAGRAELGRHFPSAA